MARPKNLRTARGSIALVNIATRSPWNSYRIYFNGVDVDSGKRLDTWMNKFRWDDDPEKPRITLFRKGQPWSVAISELSEYEHLEVEGIVKYLPKYTNKGSYVYTVYEVVIESEIKFEDENERVRNPYMDDSEAEAEPEPKPSKFMKENPFLGDPVNEAPSEEPPIKNLAQLREEAASVY